MTQVLTMVVYVLGPPVIVLVGLVLQLRWQARRERCRQDALRALVSQWRSDGALEIHDVRDDGSQVHLRITGKPDGAAAGEP